VREMDPGGVDFFTNGVLYSCLRRRLRIALSASASSNWT